MEVGSFEAATYTGVGSLLEITVVFDTTGAGWDGTATSVCTITGVAVRTSTRVFEGVAQSAVVPFTVLSERDFASLGKCGLKGVG